METGTYVYTDGTNSELFDSCKELKGIVCNITDTHAILVAPFDSEEKLDWREARYFCKDKGYQCPAIDELTVIHLNIDKINTALQAAGVDEIKKDNYWSATGYDHKTARGYSFYFGGCFTDSKYLSNYVRPVLVL